MSLHSGYDGNHLALPPPPPPRRPPLSGPLSLPRPAVPCQVAVVTQSYVTLQLMVVHGLCPFRISHLGISFLLNQALLKKYCACLLSQ